jgi:hypothetical protein
MKPLREYYAFTVYGSRQAAEQAGHDVPAQWNPARKLKYWADPNPNPATIVNFVGIGKVVVYDKVIEQYGNGEPVYDQATGQYSIGKMMIPLEEARTFNFPPDDDRFPPNAGENAAMQWPVPLALPDGARVFRSPNFGSPVVVLKGEQWPPLPSGGVPTGQLDRIEAKLDQANDMLKALISSVNLSEQMDDGKKKVVGGVPV